MKHLLLYLCSVIFLFSATAETVPFDIVPQPQSVAIDGASFEITGITISDPGRFPKAEKALREELNLQNISSESKEGKLYPVKFLLDPKLKREEYRLQTTPETATIRGAGDAGALHGVWTLRQLIRRRGEKFFLPAVRIHDYPDIRTRAVMFPSGLSSTPGSPETIQTFKKYIRAFAAMKYNALLLSPSRFTLWDSHCFPHRIPHFTKKHWKEIAEYASFYEMKIIPAFQVREVAEHVPEIHFSRGIIPYVDDDIFRQPIQNRCPRRNGFLISLYQFRRQKIVLIDNHSDLFRFQFIVIVHDFPVEGFMRVFAFALPADQIRSQ